MSDIRQVIIVAISRNSIIGRDGTMPWRLSTDLKRFKALTSGKPVIMGRKTFQSIGKPLPGRPNFIVTRDPTFAPEDVTVVNSLQDAIAQASEKARLDGVDEICVIGGGEIYRQAMETAERMYVTHIETEVEGDTSFPAIDPAVWQEEAELAVPAGERDSFATRFVTYRRR